MSKFLIKSYDSKYYSVDKVKINHVVNMTSATTPSPYVVTASSQYDDVYYSAWKAFNTITVGAYEGWLSASKNGENDWIQIDFGEKKRVNKITLTNMQNDAGYGKPKNFRVLGSNDGNEYFELLHVENQTGWTSQESRSFIFSESGNYRYYKLDCYDTGNYTIVGEILYSYEGNDYIEVESPSEYLFTSYGINSGTIINIEDFINELLYVDNSGITSKKSVNSTLLEITGENYSVLEYIENGASNNSNNSIITEVEPFSVYDHISENPQAVIYTESTDDIILSTTTEPFDLYDEFGDEVEVLLYTDDSLSTEADLILEANWSPIDELEGDIEVVTWTDEESATAQRVLEMTAIPKPQFVKLANPKRVYGYLESILVDDVSVAYRNETRYLLTDEKGVEWYVWDNISQKFVVVDISTHELVLQNGMTYEEVNSITNDQWKTWIDDYVNIGVFLKDNPRDTIVSVVENISYSDYLPRHTTSVEKGNFYILNTTAKIDLELVGNVVKGVLSDDDLTRVQYRVFLNNEIYYPADGNFTNLGDSPTNIEIVIPSKDIIMDNWNTVKVEFQDFYGTTDYWQTQFIGTYSGLMFKDIHGDYFSSEIGEVLKYLDFGVIIAGQTTIEHEVILKNQYGYDVKNIHLYADTSEFPNAMEIEFSEALSPFIPQKELILNRVLANNDEMSFFVRLKTELGATPNANGSFDIIVKADKV